MALPRPWRVALQLCVSPFHAISARTTRLPPLLVETICRPSEQPFATLRISSQRQTYAPSDVPTSPSLAPSSSPYPQQAPRTSPSEADAPPPYVLRIPQTISSVCALSPIYSRKLSWQARRRTIGCGRRASISAFRGIGGAWSGEPVVACHSRACSGSTSCNRRAVSRSPRLSATAPSTVRAHPGDHRFFHLVPLEARTGPLKTPRYFNAKFSVCGDSPT